MRTGKQIQNFTVKHYHPIEKTSRPRRRRIFRNVYIWRKNENVGNSPLQWRQVRVIATWHAFPAYKGSPDTVVLNFSWSMTQSKTKLYSV
jgi:hypothetical protein